MFFRRFYDDGLAQASYMVGCDGAREVAIVDPSRDIEQYLSAAAAERYRITHVTETHIHADFLSGSRELAARAGAKLLLSAEGGTDWQYAFAAGDGATLLKNSDSFSVGQVRFDVMHTPGHTPEHLAFIVTDTAASNRPVGMLSGDFIFVGDVGRPDLLERAANVSNTMESAARELFHSLQRTRELPDFLQLWPGHSAGSACGKALGSLPQSTLGYERVANWGLTTADENAFVTEVLSGQPEPPPYFAMMKKMNREGPALLTAWPPAQLDASRLRGTLADGALVIDTRSADAFADGHARGTLNIQLGKSFSTWCGWLVPYNRDIHLIASRQEDASRAAGELAKIGLDRVVGWFGVDALSSFTENGTGLERVAQTTANAIARKLSGGEITLVDVRNSSEWSHGHLPRALHIPLGQLASRAGEIPRDKPIVVQCQGGTRSAIGSSVLLSLGVGEIINFRGGFEEWAREARPVVHD